MPTVSRCFHVLSDAGVGWLGGDPLLDDRERAVLAGALNHHSLLWPGATFAAVVVRGPADRLPSLTGARTATAGWSPDSAAVATVLVHSAVGGGLQDIKDVPQPVPSVTDVVVVDVGGSEASGSNYDMVPGWTGRVRRTLRTRIPVAYDAARQWSTDRKERAARSRGIEGVQVRSLGRGSDLLRPRAGAPAAALFGLNWLELGGAEKWGMATVAIAAGLGAVPLVVTDKASPHPWATHPAMRNAVFLPLTEPAIPGQDAALLCSLLQEFDVRLVHVHHCLWLYERLPWLRALRPDLLVLDTLHIHEWRHGGFVTDSLRRSDSIDLHHVISPALRDLLVQNVPAEKVVMRPLLDLEERPDRPAGPVVARKAADPLVVGFVARLTQQKRPYLFLALAARLRAPAGGPIHFVLHGDGYLTAETDRLVRHYGLAGVVTRRPSSVPVAQTYAECDVVVITSDAEGLTLTALEADRAGCLVLSTDVGSQRTVTADQALLPRPPGAFLRRAESVLRRVLADPAWTASLLTEQRRKHDELAAHQGAGAWTAEVYARALSPAPAGSVAAE